MMGVCVLGVFVCVFVGVCVLVCFACARSRAWHDALLLGGGSRRRGRRRSCCEVVESCVHVALLLSPRAIKPQHRKAIPLTFHRPEGEEGGEGDRRPEQGRELEAKAVRKTSPI